MKYMFNTPFQLYKYKTVLSRYLFNGIIYLELNVTIFEPTYQDYGVYICKGGNMIDSIKKQQFILYPR